METAALISLVKQLDGNLDQLEQALGPTLEESLNATSKKLPLLDRAKLNITVVYAIESLIFSYLKVNGVDPKTHAVFKEIERVKQYFNKVKEVEEMSTAKPSITLNKQAAARIIQHSLAGNGTSDLAQREREARERLMLKRKLKAESTTPAQTPTPTFISPPSIPLTENQAAPVPIPSQHDVDMHDESSAEEGEIEEDEPTIPTSRMPEEDTPTLEQPAKRQKQKQKHKSGGPSKLSADRKAEKKARKKAKKEGKLTTNGVGNTG